MIKGVNKRIIEVLNPDEPCFEKIILFLSPNCKLPDQLLVKSTGEYVHEVAKTLGAQNLDKKKTQRKRLLNCLLLCVFLLFGALLGAVLTVGLAS